MANHRNMLFSQLFGDSGYLWQAVVVGHNELKVRPCFVGPIVVVVWLGGILTLKPATQTHKRPCLCVCPASLDGRVPATCAGCPAAVRCLSACNLVSDACQGICACDSPQAQHTASPRLSRECAHMKTIAPSWCIHVVSCLVAPAVQTPAAVSASGLQDVPGQRQPCSLPADTVPQTLTELNMTVRVIY